MFDHEALKTSIINSGKAAGLNKSDMNILSRDPFFVGTDKECTEAKWAAALWDKMMASRRKALHLRGFHYWVQSQGIAKPDGNLYAHKDPAKDWGFLLKATQVARYLGIGEWRNLVDLKHPDPQDFDNYWVGSGLSESGEVDIQSELNDKLTGLVDEFIRGLLYNSPKYHTEGYQLYHNEVLCEKNSMGFVIEPACRKYNACYQAFVGQASVEKIDMMTKRAVKAAEIGKKVRIFYIADFDRYGWSMVSAVARKIEFMLLQMGVNDADVKLTRLGLNEDHINKFKLPKAPKHGEAVVELDALEAIHPGELGKIVENALKPYFDSENPKIVEQENRRIREAVHQMLETNLRAPLQEAFKDINISDIASDVDLTSTIDPNFEVPEPNHIIDDTKGNWVFDSGRDYWAQYEEYKKYKSDRVEEEA